ARAAALAAVVAAAMAPATTAAIAALAAIATATASAAGNRSSEPAAAAITAGTDGVRSGLKRLIVAASGALVVGPGCVVVGRVNRGTVDVGKNFLRLTFHAFGHGLGHGCRCVLGSRYDTGARRGGHCRTVWVPLHRLPARDGVLPGGETLVEGLAG